MSLNLKFQLYRGALANLPATTGAPGVLAWTTDSNELFIDTGTQFQRIAPDNRVFTITNVNQLAGLPAMLGDIAVLVSGSPAVPTATYMLTSYSSPFVQGDWTLIANSSALVPLAGATAHEFVTFIDSSGVQHLAQPSFADISGNLSQTQLPASIGSGSSLTSIDAGTF